MKKFCESSREHTMKIINFGKKKIVKNILKIKINLEIIVIVSVNTEVLYIAYII